MSTSTRKYHRVTTDELNRMATLKFEKNMTYAQIAETMGLSKNIIENAFQRHISKANTVEAPTWYKPCTKQLSDFSPREMIRHLYFLGYRIENNDIVCYQKQKVNIKDIIS